MSENIAAAIAAKNEVIAQQGTSLDEVAAVLETKAAGGTDISLGLTSAAVGQIIKVKAVDESGKPTEWEAADMPSGESGDIWELIDTIALVTDTVTYDIADFTTYKKIGVKTTAKAINGSSSGNNWVRIVNADGSVIRQILANSTNLTYSMGCWAVFMEGNLLKFQQWNTTNNQITRTPDIKYEIYNGDLADKKMQIILSTQNATIVNTSSSFEVYGVKR